jgi:uncharacterized paraquat-inducible protein A
MSVFVAINVNLCGDHKELMALGFLRRLSMGKLEIIDEHGVKATFTEQGVIVDLVPNHQLCFSCDDARLLTLGDWLVCYRCGSKQ